MKIKQKLLLLYFTFAFSNSIAAPQQSVADSLLSVFNIERTDTAKATVLTKLIKEYIKTGQIEKARQTLHILLPLANKSGDNLYRGSAYNTGAFVYASEANADSMQYYANRALAILKDATGLRATRQKVIANNNLAVSYSTSGKMEKAVEVLIANLSLIKATGDDNLYQATINNISASFTMTGDHANAYKYMLQDISLTRKPGISEESRAYAYINAALVYGNQNMLKEQKQYLNMTKTALDRLGQSPLWARYYAYEAKYLAHTGQPTQALSAAQKALNLFHEYPERSNMYMIYEAIRIVELSMKRYDKARKAAQQLYEMSVADNYTDMTIKSAENIADFSLQLGDYKTAALYLQKYTRLKDSVQLQQNTQKINELETRLRTSQKEEQIVRLELEKKKTSLQIKNQKLTNILLGAACLLLFFSLTLFFFFYRSKKRAAVQKEKLTITEIMLTTQEGERERIARDLHDGLVGSLSGIKMNLALVADRQVDDDTKIAISRSADQLGSSIQELRDIAHNMMPEMLLHLGLEAALKDLCHLLEAAGILVQQEFMNLEQTIAVDKQVIIYRIVQELFSNIIRHAQASTVFFQCARQSDIFLITVEDDGVGLPNTNKTAGIGLKSIENRVRYLNGTVDIGLMSTGKGTSVNIQLYVA